MTVEKYGRDESLKACIEYFNGDELAAGVFINKYALRNKEGDLLEKTPDHMHKRIANEFSRIENKYANSLSFEEIFKALDKFKYIIPQGSPMFGIGNNEQLVSIGNCFVVESPDDSYASILWRDELLVQIMKRRGGCGIDISNLRPRMAYVNNAARSSSGAVSFAQRYSKTTQEVAQGGRRGALLISLDCRHPDLLEFIKVKNDHTKVTGANISVKWNNDFLKAVEEKKTYTLRFPVDAPIEQAQYTKEVNAHEIWEEFVKSNWKSAEPGCLFWNTIIDQSISDCYKDFGFQTVSTNPCIVGDTLIAVADGRNAVSIKQLAKEGKDVPVYSTDINSGQRQIKWGRNPRKTKTNVEVWKLTLDDGSELIATPDHKILKKNMTYVELKDLKRGDSLNPFYSFDSNNYRQINSVGSPMIGGKYRNRRQYRLIYEFYKDYIDPKKYAIHHKDFSSINDSIDNLEIMLHEDHQKLHSSKMFGINNPYHKMSNEWKQYFAIHNGEENGRYTGHTNDDLIEAGKILFKRDGKLNSRNWVKFAKENGYPQFLGNDFRFGSFNNFKHQVCENHKVKSVEFYGYEDVYNITVDDNHNYDVITSYKDDKYIVSSGITIKNCGEITLSPNGACILLVVNLASFVKNMFTKKASFDFNLFEKYTRMAVRLIDDMIDLEIEKCELIINKIEKDYAKDPATFERELNLWKNIRKNYFNGRRTGLGITGLGDTIAYMNMQYGTEEALEFVAELFSKFHYFSYSENTILAKERGSFPIWNWDLEKDSHYIKILPDSVKNDIKKFGRRNIAINTCAPTGTVSILTQTTSGIEPVYKRVYERQRKMAQDDYDRGLKPVKTDSDGIEWISFNVEHHGYKKWLEMFPKEDPKNSPYEKSQADEIDPKFRVDMQGIIQKFIDHSISSTCNLKEDIKNEEVSELYIRAWKKGCKGFTIFREGSREGVLSSAKKKDKREESEIIETHAPKRPQILECEIHKSNVKNKKWIFFVGLHKGKPYEIFGGRRENIEIPNKYKNGWIVKDGRVNGKRQYDLYLGSLDDENEQIIIKDIASQFSAEVGSYTRIISTMLRHGVPIKFICEQLKKDEKESSMFSFESVAARILKKFIRDGEVAGELCECGQKYIYKDGCKTCLSCGNSKCS